ncbi:hypothetical protein ACOME3_002523 [Neoechinorhynchus agilis]
MYAYGEIETIEIQRTKGVHITRARFMEPLIFFSIDTEAVHSIGATTPTQPLTFQALQTLATAHELSLRDGVDDASALIGSTRSNRRFGIFIRYMKNPAGISVEDESAISGAHFELDQYTILGTYKLPIPVLYELASLIKTTLDID